MGVLAYFEVNSIAMLSLFEGILPRNIILK